MRKFIILFSAFVFSIHVFSQKDTTIWKSDSDLQKQFDIVSQGLPNKADTTYWITEGDFSIQFNQVSFSNWAAGGNNSYAAVAGINYSFNYAKAKSSWDNKLVLSYGMQSLDGDIRKTTDKIDFASKYGHTLKKKINFGVLFSIKSQFTKGYKYPNTVDYVSNFAAPMYIGIGPGIDYKPNKFFSVFIAPATAQWVIVSDISLAEAYGNEPNKKVRTQFGMAIKMEFKKDIAKNINLDTKLELFSDYLNNPEKVIVLWDMALDMKVNKLISAKLTTGVIWDQNIIFTNSDGNPESRIQFKEMFGAGLSVKF